MHFPTSLPRPAGSPSASTHILVQDNTAARNASARFPIQRKIKSSPQAHFPLKNRPPVPLYSAQPAEEDDEVPDIPLPRSVHALRHRHSMTTLPSTSVSSHSKQHSSTHTKHGSSSYLSTTNGLDGPISSVDGSSKSRLTSEHTKQKLRSMAPKLFSKKRTSEDDDGRTSLTEASEFYAMKREKAGELKVPTPDPASEKRRSVSPRERISAMMKKGKSTPGKGLELEDDELHPLEGARRRMSEQRERKMRRANSGSRTSRDGHSVMVEERKIQLERRGSHSKRHGSGVSDPATAYRVSREEEMVGGDVQGNRAVNAVRRVSYQLAPGHEEADAPATRWAQPGMSRRGSADVYPSTSESGEYYETVTRPDGRVVPIPPRAEDYQETQPYLGSDTSVSQDVVMYDVPQGNVPYGQLMYPPRPPAPFFKPTLSPVSSRSAVPTTAAPTRTNTDRSSPQVRVERSQQVSESLHRKHFGQLADPSASSLHLPLPEVPVPDSRLHGLTIRNGQSAIVSSGSSYTGATAGKSPNLSPIEEVASPPPESVRKTAQSRPSSHATDPTVVQFSPSNTIMAIKPPSSRKVTPKVVKFQSPPPRSPIVQEQSSTPKEERLMPREQTQTSPEDRRTPPDGSVRGSDRPPTTFSEILRKDNEELLPEPWSASLRASVKTPTPSALEFWKEADESIHPSESASAQVPNRYGQPPPKFWRAADLSMEDRRAGPTMEEWIATLPGLGLGLGQWGNSDGALDLKYYQSLKSDGKKGSNDGKGSVRSILSIATQEMIMKDMENFEKAVRRNEEEILVLNQARGVDEPMTPEEAEAIKVSDEEDGTESALANQPPPVVNPRLLHPLYTPGSSILARAKQDFAFPRAKLSTVASSMPKGKLGRDMVNRLDELEQYWEEQSQTMGRALKHMLIVVDNILVKEREESQKQQRRREMGWYDSSDDIEGDERRPTTSPQTRATLPAPSQQSCNVA